MKALVPAAGIGTRLRPHTLNKPKALLPVAGPQTMSWLEVNEPGNLLLRLGTLGTAPVSCTAPVLSWARSPDLYAAVRTAWDRALKCELVRGRTTWRSPTVCTRCRT